jgi:hypothetical protein
LMYAVASGQLLLLATYHWPLTTESGRSVTSA